MQMRPDWKGVDVRISKNNNAQRGAWKTGTLTQTPRVSLHECSVSEKPFDNVCQQT